MSTVIGIKLEELRDEITKSVTAAFLEYQQKVNASRLCNAKETRILLGNVSHVWLSELKKRGYLTPQTGGGSRGSDRYYRYEDIMQYVNRKKKS
jgi:hypothetical protein